MINRHLHDRLEVLIAMLAPHIPWVNSILREEFGSLRMSSEKLVAVVVEITHDGRGESVIGKPLDNLRDRCGSSIIIHGHADKLTTGSR